MSVLGPGHCDTCKWWGGERAHCLDHPYGTCRAEPPSMGKAEALPYHDPDRPEVASPIVTMGEWPWTAFDDWCAAHLQKPNTET